MYITASFSASSLLRATRSKLSFSSISRTFAYPPSSTRTFSSATARSFCYSVPRWSHRLEWRSPLTLRPQIRAVAPVIERFHRKIATMANENPFKGNLTSLPKPGGGEFGKFYSLPSLNDPRVDRLPYSIRVLLESAVRSCDNFQVTKEDVEKIIDWENTCAKLVEIPFKPARVLLQDFTGVPAVVDLACMRDAMNKLGSDSNKINPLRPKAFGQDTNVLVGARYGNGSSRVWAAQGPMLLGVNAVMARSFERNVDTNTLGLTGQKRFMSDVTGTISETKAYGLRPLSPHLPVYQPHLSATLSICNRISGALLSAVILLFYMIYMKMGLISLSYDSFYQFLFYSSKLNLLAVEVSTLALSYHLYAGIRHLVHKL